MPRLFAELADSGVYRIAALLSLKTGLRLGEVSALRWGDVRESERIIWVRRQFTGGVEKQRTKSGKPRQVPASEEVFAMLAEWWAQLGRPDDGFPRVAIGHEHEIITPRVVARRELYPAMRRAGIPARTATASCARSTASATRSPASGSRKATRSPCSRRHLGHSSTLITDAVYAHISAKATLERSEALAGAFPV